MILYPENEQDMKTLEYITINFRYAYIVHNKDTTEDGERKKEHIHIIFEFENERSITSVAKELNVEEYDIEKIRSKKGAIRYLIHKDTPEKFQYEIDQIQTNMTNIESYFKDRNTENEDMIKIITFLYGEKRKVMIFEVLSYALDNNLYSTFRRAGNQIIKIIEEHNDLYKENKKTR